MVSALRYYENGIFHFNVVKKLLDGVVNNCPKKSALSVMDIGCGSGRLLLGQVVASLPENFSEIVGVDKYQSMIEHCRTLSTDPRISFEQLDITTKEVPKKYVERFDIITSFFSLHYARDYNQSVRNIRTMLKPNGELIYIQPYNTNPLYESYRELCKIDRWKPFLQDFQNYVAHFSESDRESRLEDIYRRNGLRILKYAFDGLRLKLIPKQFEASIQALDNLGRIIPEDQKEAYLEDYHRIFCEIMKFDEENLETEKEVTVDCLTVHAQKP